MLDLNQVRADFATFLAGNADKRHSLDAALMHVVEAAYQKGLADALLVPAVLRESRPDMDGSLAAGNRSAACVEPAAVCPPPVPGREDGAGQGGSAESGNPAPARSNAPTTETLKGGALAKLAAMWCGEARFQTWLQAAARDVWDRHATKAAQAATVGNIDHLIAGNVLREILRVKTRAELDHVPAAAAAFHTLIRAPYAQSLKGH